MIARAGLVALAVAVLALLAPMLADERALERARGKTGLDALVDIESARGSAAGESRIRQAQNLLFSRRADLAVRAVRPLAEREPENLEAWRTLARAARAAGDEPLAERARARLRELDPLSGR